LKNRPKKEIIVTEEVTETIIEPINNVFSSQPVNHQPRSYQTGRQNEPVHIEVNHYVVNTETNQYSNRQRQALQRKVVQTRSTTTTTTSSSHSEGGFGGYVPFLLGIPLGMLPFELPTAYLKTLGVFGLYGLSYWLCEKLKFSPWTVFKFSMGYTVGTLVGVISTSGPGTTTNNVRSHRVVQSAENVGQRVAKKPMVWKLTE